MRAPPEKDDRLTASDWLAQHGLRAEQFSKHELRQDRDTPDFRLYRGDELVGFCEVKSPNDDDWLAKEIRQAPPLRAGIAARRDPTFNRLARLIEKAVEQFDSVNPDRALPNILVLINWADANHFEDLEETVRGWRKFDGVRVVTVPQIAEGRIATLKDRIDLYVWIDGPTQRPEGCMFSGDFVFRDKICGWLGIDPANIEASE
jgi:hypothetical protein